MNLSCLHAIAASCHLQHLPCLARGLRAASTQVQYLAASDCTLLQQTATSSARHARHMACDQP